MTPAPETFTALIGQTMRAIGFLSRLPVPTRYWDGVKDTGIAADARAFPLAGIVIAAGPAMLLVVLAAIGAPPLLVAGFTVLSLVAITGALHEDGLGDVADGFGGGATKEKRLAIMKDSRIGTYGAIAIAGGLMLRVAAVAAILTAQGAAGAGFALLGAAALSRAAMVWMWASLPNARGEGVAHDAGTPTRGIAIFAAGVALAIFLGIAFATSGVANALTALALVIAALFLFRQFSLRMIGGQTGDTLGASQQIAEVMALTGLALAI